MQAVNNMHELGLYKAIREREIRNVHLEDMIAKHKLGHDNDIRQIERLEQELADREECIYKLNKQCLTYQIERKKYDQVTYEDTILSMQQTIDSQKKEIGFLNTKIQNIEAVLIFQEDELRRMT